MDVLDAIQKQRGSTAAFASLVVLSVVIFAVVYHYAATALMAFIPMYIFIVAVIIAVLMSVVLSLPVGGLAWLADKDFQGASQRLIVVLLLTAALVLTASAIFCWTCLTPRPMERFVDASSGLETLQVDVAAAEVDVCTYITRADQFIKSDVGPAGTKDPSLVTAAEAKAREGVNMVLCSDGVPAATGVVDETMILADLEDRVARIESTVAGLTGVVFKRAYDETVPCKEGFVTQVPSVADLQTRVTAVRATIADQKTLYLDPIDQKTADLQAGKASDCDKRRGAKLAAAGGPKPAS
jgi:hypothetical protein